jgi:hypothetical protein
MDPEPLPEGVHDRLIGALEKRIKGQA